MAEEAQVGGPEFDRTKAIDIFGSPVTFEFNPEEETKTVKMKDIDLGSCEFPKDEWKVSKDFDWYIIPGVFARVGASAGGGVKLGGSLSGSGTIKDDANWELEVTGTGSVTAEIWGKLVAGVGVGIPGANLAVELFGQPKLEAKIATSLTGKIGKKNGQWFGKVENPIDLSAELAATCGLQLRGKFLWWEKELASIQFGKITIATAGVKDNMSIDFVSGKMTHETTEPFIKWGEPPKAPDSAETTALREATNGSTDGE